MKKVLIALSIVLVLGLMWGAESTYTRTATITNSDNGIVTAKDKSGHIWQYKGTAIIGDDVILIMNDNHTSTVTDDIIKRVK